MLISVDNEDVQPKVAIEPNKNTPPSPFIHLPNKWGFLFQNFSIFYSLKKNFAFSGQLLYL